MTAWPGSMPMHTAGTNCPVFQALITVARVLHGIIHCIWAQSQLGTARLVIPLVVTPFQPSPSGMSHPKRALWDLQYPPH